MIKIVVDTNIVFSALLNPTGNFYKILLTRKNFLQFYSSDSLVEELAEHRLKILKYSKLSTENLKELEVLIFSNINFINGLFIPKKHLITAKEMLKNVDLEDVPFVALTNHLKAKLWTGDKELISGLKKKKFKNIISTAQLLKLLNEFKDEND